MHVCLTLLAKINNAIYYIDMSFCRACVFDVDKDKKSIGNFNIADYEPVENQYKLWMLFTKGWSLLYLLY